MKKIARSVITGKSLAEISQKNIPENLANLNQETINGNHEKNEFDEG